MRNTKGLWMFAFVLVLLDTYIFTVLKFLISNYSNKAKVIVYSTFWLLTVCSIAIVILLPQLYFNPKYKLFITYAFSMVFGLFFFKLIIVLFFLVDDVRRMLSWLVQKIMPTKVGAVTNAIQGVSRSHFITWLGIGVGTTVYGTLLWGFGNKYKYLVRNVKLKYSNLPVAFNGLKIVQLSDIHSGSFTNKAAVKKGIEKIIALQPDLILFTGDLVNNLASEMDDYKDEFAKLTAPLGVYSILGNHDYGDYYLWPDRDESIYQKQKQSQLEYCELLEKNIDYVNWAPQKIAQVQKANAELVANYKLYSPQQQSNIEQLYNTHKGMGWQLLLNKHVVLKKDNDSIALIGIENWGARGNFPKYGNLQQAHLGTESIPFKILLSHDPSHWQAQVLPYYPDIDLMLAGHTHGMQFGVELPGFKWSPVQYVYKQWAGVYEAAKQKLYVNRGFGFLGYPGRVGILPEITFIQLYNA